MLAGATADDRGHRGRRRAAATTALDVWQERFWDDAEGMAVEQWDRTLDAGSTTTAALNANMHGVEATLAAADALPDRRPGRQAAGCATRRCAPPSAWCTAGRGSRDWRLPEHFTADWTPLPDYNRDRPADPFRPYGVTVGHQFEWARLACTSGRSPHAPPCWLTADAGSCSPAAAERGWAADGHDGFPYTLDWDDRAGRRRPHALGALRGDRGRLRAGRGDRRRRATAICADDWRGRSASGCSPTRRPAAGTTSSRPAGEVGTRHLGRPARRLPPGADAAAGRPPGAGQPRRRAALRPITAGTLHRGGAG